jgi:TonB family protein
MLQILQMRRYLILSIFLHLLVFISFFYHRSAVIDDPIVAVSLEVKDAAFPIQKKSVVNSIKSLLSNRKTFQAPSPSNANTKTLETNSAYEPGNVSVKPKVMKQIQVVYPQQAKEARVEGAVRLSVVINELGEVFDVKVLEGPGYGLNEAAQDALKQFIFSPAEVEGKKVPVRIVYIYRFKLESR